MSQRLLTLAAVARYLGVSRPTAYNIVQVVGFPKPIKVPTTPGRTAKRWSADAVALWCAVERAPK